jgi:hypothetical protein
VIKRNPLNNIEISDKISEDFLKVLTLLDDDTESNGNGLFPIFLKKKVCTGCSNNDYIVAFILQENGEVYIRSRCDNYGGIGKPEDETRSSCCIIEINEVTHYKMNRIIKETTISQENLDPMKMTMKAIIDKSSFNDVYKKTFEKIYEFLQHYSLL